MLQLNGCRGRVRPWIAMVAAYAVALQVLLAGWMPHPHPVDVVDPFDEICLGAGSDGAPASERPARAHVRHDCFVLCSVALGVAPAPAAVPVAYPSIASQRHIARSVDGALSNAPPASPRQSQGPPYNA